MRATMGAMDIFRKETGKDPSEMRQDSPVDIAVFIYGCVKSACRKDKVDFPYSLEEFEDSVDIETILGWSDELSKLTPQSDDSKKGQVATYGELFGYGVGVVGLSVDDFLDMDTDDFDAVCKSFGDHEEQLERERWERMRLLGLMTVQPWSKKKLTAEKLLPLPWDKQDGTLKDAAQSCERRLSKEEHMKQAVEMLKLLGDKY